MRRVNKARVGQHYKDVNVAKKYKGTTEKQKLPTDYFIVKFEYGTSNEGYWNYEIMVLQLEDCVNVLKVLWPQMIVYFYSVIPVAMISKELMD
jgi:hypothetical protein